MSKKTIQTPHFPLSANTLKTFCQKWNITELSLFGSILRDDFRPDSDIDVLVSFAPNSPWTIIDLIVIEQELAALVNRDVDLIEKRVIQNSSNPIRKAAILNSATVVYAQTTTDETTRSSLLNGHS
jgi:hypothetical protein